MDQQQNEIYLGDTTVEGFAKRLFSYPPQDRYSLRLEFLEAMNEERLRNILGIFLVIGAEQLYQKKLHELNTEDQLMLRKYFHSFGYDCEFQKTTICREVTDYHPDGTPFQKIIPVNNWQFLFGRAPLREEPLTKLE